MCEAHLYKETHQHPYMRWIPVLPPPRGPCSPSHIWEQNREDPLKPPEVERRGSESEGNKNYGPTFSGSWHLIKVDFKSFLWYPRLKTHYRDGMIRSGSGSNCHLWGRNRVLDRPKRLMRGIHSFQRESQKNGWAGSHKSEMGNSDWWASVERTQKLGVSEFLKMSVEKWKSTSTKLVPPTEEKLQNLLLHWPKMWQLLVVKSQNKHDADDDEMQKHDEISQHIFFNFKEAMWCCLVFNQRFRAGKMGCVLLHYSYVQLVSVPEKDISRMEEPVFFSPE